MSEKLKVIYLQYYEEGESIDERIEAEEKTWCEDKINDDDVEYILKSEYDHLHSELAALKEASRWTPTEENVPSDFWHILIKFKNTGIESSGFYRPFNQCWFDSFAQKEYPFDAISHWKMLPLPKEDE